MRSREGGLRGMEDRKFCFDLMTLDEGEASNWLSVGYLKRQVLILVCGGEVSGSERVEENE